MKIFLQFPNVNINKIAWCVNLYVVITQKNYSGKYMFHSFVVGSCLVVSALRGLFEKQTLSTTGTCVKPAWNAML